MPAQMAKTHFLSDAILNEVLRNVEYAQPATVYVALFTSATDKNGGGTEVSGGGYARQPVTFGAPGAGVDGRKVANSAEVAFPVATASWGTITHVAIMDAATAGNMLYQGAMEASKTIGVNDQLKFAVGDLSVEEK
jgi:hypothetical protein